MSEEKKPLSRSEREAKIKDKAGWVITVLAALLAVNTLIGGSNSSKVLNNTIASNNQWAWYQAKNVRQVLYETAALQAKPEHKEKLQAEAERMAADKKEIAANAKKLEDEREVAKKRSPWFTYSGSLFQIAIVLLSASILAVSMPLFWASIAVGSVASLTMSQALWLWVPLKI